MPTSRIGDRLPNPHVAPPCPLGVTVVVPCFNEEESALQLADMLLTCEQRLHPTYDVQFVIVDDGSLDATLSVLRQQFAERRNYRIARHPENCGVAAAIMTGIRESTTEIVCSVDSDGSYDPQHLVQMIPHLTNDVALVTASPYHRDGEVVNVPTWRLAISRCASWLYGRAMKQQLATYTSCFRVYRRSNVVDIELAYPGFEGVAELLWRIGLRGHDIVEVPTRLDVRKYGQSKMRVAQVAWGHVGLLSRVLAQRVFAIRRAAARRNGHPHDANVSV